MRVIMLVHSPLSRSTLPPGMEPWGRRSNRFLDAIKPEATYFTERDGRRGGIFVVDVQNASDIPRLAEPLFLSFNAEVEFRIAMTPEDLAHADLKRWERSGPEELEGAGASLRPTLLHSSCGSPQEDLLCSGDKI